MGAQLDALTSSLYPTPPASRNTLPKWNIRMTERLYYTDAYLRDFTARVVGQSPNGLVYLDRTAFYPTSGGQPFDTGSIAGARVIEVNDEEDRIAHRVASPV